MRGTNTLSTAEAVELTGEKNVTQFLRVMKRNGISPVKELPGIRGAKFWDENDLANYPYTTPAPVESPQAPGAGVSSSANPMAAPSASVEKSTDQMPKGARAA